MNTLMQHLFSRVHKPAMPLRSSAAEGLAFGASHDDIARLAYEFWTERHHQRQDHYTDWFRAERELRNTDTEKLLTSLCQELETARQIQEQLLPTVSELVAGVSIHAHFWPAGLLAGDFYEVLCGGRGVGLLIADVSGRGVAAALLASMLKVALRAQPNTVGSPARMLNGLNTILSSTLQDQFVTAAYVYLDTSRNVVRYAGAAHPPVLLWSSGSRRIDCLERNGMLLGPFPGARYSELTLPFEPGDRCLLYTDGLLEAPNRAGEEYGLERLRQFVESRAEDPPDVLCDTLFREITEWTRDGPQTEADDITFVLAEFQKAGKTESERWVQPAACRECAVMRGER